MPDTTPPDAATLAKAKAIASIYRDHCAGKIQTAAAEKALDSLTWVEAMQHLLCIDAALRSAEARVKELEGVLSTREEAPLIAALIDVRQRYVAASLRDFTAISGAKFEAADAAIIDCVKAIRGTLAIFLPIPEPTDA